jgi:hypothetical protein
LVAAPDGARTVWSEPNPNTPAINPTGHGVENAVVFLRGVDPERARPWDHGPVRVEQRGCRFHVLQDGRDSFAGFVRRGEPVEMVSRDPFLHVLHAGGAAFFSLAFPDPDSNRLRRLNEAGVVELTSAAGFFHMRAYLFVGEHPYFTRTSAEGHFEIGVVPPGNYEVVCWLPNWAEERREREPETGVVCRLYFRPPAERARRVLLRPGSREEVNHSLSADDFDRRPERRSPPAARSAATGAANPQLTHEES